MAVKELRPIRIEGNVAYIQMTRGYVATIDAADAHLAEGWNWSAVPNGKTVYAQRCARVDGRQKKYGLHRIITSAPDGVQVDHINGDGLDNRRANLRLATHAENSRNVRRPSNNKSGFKGVYKNAKTGRWAAMITGGGQRQYLGQFDTPEEAHSAYCKAAAFHHGEFARAT